MKKLLLPALCSLVLMAACHRAIHTAPSRDSATVLHQLLQIEAEIAVANRDCDYAYFRRVEADEFIFTDGSGAVTTKAQDLASEKDCRKSTALTLVDEPRLLLYGEVAVLNARSSVEAKNRDGQTVVRRNRFTDVFVWRDGRWQLVSGQSTRIAP
jgi:ketosteroid isomerase-like protein